MDRWVCERLSELLEFPVPDDLVQYVVGLQNSRDTETYLQTLLNFENPKHRLFLTEFLQKKKAPHGLPVEKGTNKKKKFKPVVSLATSTSVPTAPAVVPSALGKENGVIKKKQKFVNLYSQDGQEKEVILLKGRHHCDCQASRHQLVNNCTRCGRVVCRQEGSGPCLFCGSLVCSPEEQALLGGSTRRAAALHSKLVEQRRPQGWEAALAQRNRLLDYDRTSERRTRVTDDDSDYFSSGSVWLSKAEREKLEKYHQGLRDKKHASRLQQTFTLDFAGRQVVEEQNWECEPNEEVLRQITTDTQHPAAAVPDPGDLHPAYCGPALQFNTSVNSVRLAQIGKMGGGARVQDAELQTMGDRGFCLSMHQPWASLLVSGIKMHEGRSWYSPHRGRLWVAATAQASEPDTVVHMQEFYSSRYPDEKIIFPDNYPSGCLLGCVTVEDCLPQEEYRQKYPEGESESPFVLICSDARALPLRFPISGKHKIYMLDSKIHQAAVKSLQRLAKLESKE